MQTEVERKVIKIRKVNRGTILDLGGLICVLFFLNSDFSGELSIRVLENIDGEELSIPACILAYILGGGMISLAFFSCFITICNGINLIGFRKFRTYVYRKTRAQRMVFGNDHYPYEVDGEFENSVRFSKIIGLSIGYLLTFLHASGLFHFAGL